MSSDYDIETDQRRLVGYTNSGKKRKYCLGITIAILIIIIVSVAVTYTRESGRGDTTPKNVIILIPDGTGPATFTGTREYLKATQGLDYLNIDKILQGSARTYSSDNLITDSAAGATAYASCQKSYNGAIGVDVSGLPLGTLFEAAKLNNMVTGFVVTSRVTHATPACFSSHVSSRNDENDIASQQAQIQNLDFALGGGRQYFDPAQRSDGLDLYSVLQNRGYSLLLNGQAFTDHVNTGFSFPVFGLFADSNLNFEMDRWKTDQPSLSTMTAAVLNQLASNSSIVGSGGRGFIMMIEGSRIDHAGHNNDAIAHLTDCAEFDKTVAEVLEFQKKFPNTFIVSVADHETGGMSLGMEGSGGWFPLAISHVNVSAELLTPIIMPLPSNQWNTTFHDNTQLYLNDNDMTTLTSVVGNSVRFTEALGRAISRAAGIAWSTTQHSGVDVGIYASGPSDPLDQLKAVHENYEVCEVVKTYLSLPLQEVTDQLRATSQASQRSLSPLQFNTLAAITTPETTSPPDMPKHGGFD